MKVKRNRLKQLGEISWMVFAISIVTVGIVAENIYKNKKLFKKS